MEVLLYFVIAFCYAVSGRRTVDLAPVNEKELKAGMYKLANFSLWTTIVFLMLTNIIFALLPLLGVVMLGVTTFIIIGLYIAMLGCIIHYRTHMG